MGGGMYVLRFATSGPQDMFDGGCEIEVFEGGKSRLKSGQYLFFSGQ